jgi:hypothetical protein
MNPLIQPKTITSPLLITLTLLCFGFFPKAQAVVPPPDGGYPGGTTAEGQAALFSLTTGTFNTAVGFLSLRSNTDSSFNTAIGAGALLANDGPLSNGNTAIGTAALLSNVGGGGNTATGAFALISNTDGSANTASGHSALFSNIIGVGNTAAGQSALHANTTGAYNTASGYLALVNSTNGTDNTAIGYSALFNNSTGSRNIALGSGAGFNITTASDTICIGIPGVNVTDGCYIGHIFQESIDPDNLGIAIDVHGKVGTPASSRRFKNDIKPMDKASEVILGLKPVTFYYKSDAKCSQRFGLIAEEVAEVDPKLVARDREGKPYSVRYDQVNAMLLNEFLKEHRKVEALEAKVVQQRKDFQAAIVNLKETVTARLDEQASQVQKVSAQLEASKPAPQVVNNP